MAMTGRAAPATAGAEPNDRALGSALRAVGRRVRLQRALNAAAALSVAALAFSALGMGLLETRLVRADVAHALLLAACALPVAGFVVGAMRGVAPLFVAKLIDRSLATPDLIASAWAFQQVPEAERTPFMRACVDQALRESTRVVASHAFPLRAPRALYAALALGVCVLLLSRLSPPAERVVPAPKVAKPRLLEQDDLQAFAQDVAAIRIDAHTEPDVRDAALELNALLEALADQKLERTEALRELRGLEQRLENAARSEDSAALREALRELGRNLGKDSLAESVAAAMAQADAAEARKSLERLAKQVAEQSPRGAARSKLERALNRAAHTADSAAKDKLDKARAELERLLKKQMSAEHSVANERLLRDKRRELEQLERQAQERSNGERQLDDLRRELSSAAQSLGGGQDQQAAQHMQKGAQSLERSQHSQLSEQQRKQLRERVQQLREQLSKQRQAQAGNGKDDKAGQAKNQQQSGQGQAQRLNLQHFSKAASGSGGEPQPGGDAQNGKPASHMLMPSQGGEPGAELMLPGEGNNPSSSVQVTESEAADGSRAGQGGRPESGPHGTRLSSTRVDTRVTGEVGEGPSRSDVIREAGQHGFVARDYQRVHGEYARHAEAVVERDQVPGGYRFYVRRYFQLIRPREETR
jgi:hypothetical protein